MTANTSPTPPPDEEPPAAPEATTGEDAATVDEPRGDSAAVARLAETLLPDLPVLDEVPELAQVLGRLRLVDQLLAEAVEGLLRLQDSLLVEDATGVALEQWLAIVARRTRTDRGMLNTTAVVLRRLPSLRAAFSQHRISWAQVRSVVLRVQPLPRHLDDQLDAELARAIDEAGDADPDALLRVVTWVCTSLDPENAEPRETPPVGEFLYLQPRLDGGGGTFYGQAGAENFAIIDAHLSAPAPAVPDVAPTRTHLGGARDPERSGRAAATVGQARLHRLVDLLRSSAAADAGDPVRPPRVILRAELDTLLGGSAPGQLLTHLAGGRMTVDAKTARRLAQQHGADLRLILTDHGRVVGVGRRRRHAPEWLDDALLALHDTCTTVGCNVAARACETDHAIPWERGGPTDVANCAPMCRHDNSVKEAQGWTVSGAPDGSRHWYHPRSGLDTRTLPGTWRPPAHTLPGHLPGPGHAPIRPTEQDQRSPDGAPLPPRHDAAPPDRRRRPPGDPPSASADPPAGGR